jgi:hypothetical protein
LRARLRFAHRLMRPSYATNADSSSSSSSTSATSQALTRAIGGATMPCLARMLLLTDAGVVITEPELVRRANASSSSSVAASSSSSSLSSNANAAG